MKSKITLGKKRKFTRLKKTSFLNVDDVNWYLENNLDLNEYYDKVEEPYVNVGRKKDK